MKEDNLLDGQLDTGLVVKKNLNRNYGKVIYYSVNTMIYMSAVNAGAGIISEMTGLMGYKGLGNAQLMTTYLFSSLFTLIAPSFVSQAPAWNQLFFVTNWGYIIFLLNGVLINTCYIPPPPHSEQGSHQSYLYCQDSFMFPTIIVLSILVSFLSSIGGIGGNQYTSECTVPENQGRFFGISNALTQSSLLIGNLASALIIEATGNLLFFIIMAFVAIIVTFMVLLVRKPDKRNESDLNEEQVELAAEVADFKQKPVKQQVQQTVSIMFTRKLLPFLIYMFMSGLIISFEAGIIYQIVEHASLSESTSVVEQRTFKVNICVGIAEFVGGYINSKIGDKLEQKQIGRWTTNQMIIAITLSIIALELQSYILCFFVAFCWGCTDCMTTSTSLSLISERFGDDVRVYSLFNLMQGIGAALGMVVSIFIRMDSALYYGGFVILYTFVANVFLANLPNHVQSGNEKQVYHGH